MIRYARGKPLIEDIGLGTGSLSRGAEWCFGADEISSWAHFSGDYNPIHFCADAARRAGSPEIIVHGMLPLVYVKQTLASAFDVAHDHADWLKVFCRFQSPMRQGESHHLTIEDDGRFALHVSRERSRTVLEGIFTPLGDFKSGMSMERIDISAFEVQERISQFAVSFPNVDALWIALDSLAFSRLITTDSLLPILRGRRLTEGVALHSELLRRAIALQTTHSVAVSPWFLSRVMRDAVCLDAIRIELGAPHVVRDTPTMLLGSQPADVLVGAKVAIRCEIGFLFRRLTTGDGTLGRDQ